MKEEEILSQQPFRKILRIIKVNSLLGTNSVSGNTFQVIGSDKKIYKLHYANKLSEAKQIENNVLLFPHIFPKFYGREGRYLLFDWIEGRMLTKEDKDLSIYKKLGELCADVHNANQSGGQEVDIYFLKRLKTIPEKILSQTEKVKIIEKYTELKEKFNLDIVLEINDIHAKNFMIDKNQNIYLVDEGGVNHVLKGLGFAKAFLSWFNEEQRTAFWEGYTAKHEGDYFDKDYETFVTIVECVRAISFRAKTGKEEKSFKLELDTLKSICGI